MKKKTKNKKETNTDGGIYFGVKQGNHIELFLRIGIGFIWPKLFARIAVASSSANHLRDITPGLIRR